MNKQEQLKENVIKCCIEGKMTVKQTYMTSFGKFSY